MFIVFSLPRSRSAWVSTFLGREARVGHDIGVECSTAAEFLARLEGCDGSCETAAAFAWPLLKAQLPHCKFAVVLRKSEDAAASLERQGLPGQLPEMQRQMEDLLRVASDAATLTVSYDSLEGFDACRLLYQHCLDKPCDAEWWAQLATLNIQLDLPLRLSRLAANYTRNEALKAEVRRLLAQPGLVIAPEPWTLNLWDEAEPLARESFAEVEPDMPGRSFAPNVSMLTAMAANGSLKVFTARFDGRLVGYLTWHLGPDMEGAGGLIAHQGAWFVAKGYSRAAFALFKRSLEDLRAMGVASALPHSAAKGRGASLGRFFRRHGAQEVHTVYSLSLRQQPHA